MQQNQNQSSFPTFQTLIGNWYNKHILHLQLNRPNKLNSFNKQFFLDLIDAFQFINKCQDLRCVILTSQGKIFSAGLDLKEAPEMLFNYSEEIDQARKSIRLYEILKIAQSSIQSLSACRVPILVGVHGMCIGGGLDLICAGDIRYCTIDTKFTIKEVDIGTCADLGTMQRMPLITSNDSLFRELSYTGRFFDANEAKQLGLVSKIVQDKEVLISELIKLAETIAQKSPVAIWTIKQVLNHDQNQHFQSNLEYMARVNSTMLFTDDMQEAVRANLGKTKPQFPKL